MAETALDLITNSLLDLGVLSDEEVPTASQAAGALRKLNNMIDSWNIEGLMVFGGTASVFPFVPNQFVYTLGTGGNFNIPRPNSINDIYVRDLTTGTAYDMPIKVLNQDEYASIAFKTQTQGYPLAVYVNETFPLIQLTFWPVPTSASYSVVLWTSGIISEFTLNQTISLAPGYKRAIEANLCIELAGSYGVEVPQTVALVAQTSKAQLKIQNFSLDTLEIDPVLRSGLHYDIRIGRYR